MKAYFNFFLGSSWSLLCKSRQCCIWEILFYASLCFRLFSICVSFCLSLSLSRLPSLFVSLPLSLSITLSLSLSVYPSFSFSLSSFSPPSVFPSSINIFFPLALKVLCLVIFLKIYNYLSGCQIVSQKSAILSFINVESPGLFLVFFFFIPSLLVRCIDVAAPSVSDLDLVDSLKGASST